MRSLYIHIPFCAKKCRYCDFYSIEDLGGVGVFLEALEREVALVRPRVVEPVETVFVGGGTPSLLDPAQLARILATVRHAFPVTPDAETTLEANPGTVGLDSLRGYRALGVNRLSLGVQSFSDAALRQLGRIHDARAARQAMAEARTAGFSNVSLDLIYAVPGQTLAAWEDDLRVALDFAPEHLSAYALTIERHTPLGRDVGSGRVRPTGSDLEAAMFDRTMAWLDTKGYEHYEVSNYARPGFPCRHNLNYWRHGPYLGLGPGAHSFERHTARRWWNVSSLSAYAEQLAAGRLPIAGAERLGPDDVLAERIFLGLRNGGVDVQRLADDLGYDLRAKAGIILEGLEQDGAIASRDGVLRLTRTGYLVADEIARRLMPGASPIGSSPPV